MQLMVFAGDPPLKGGTTWGMTFGIIGTALIITAFLYSWRKRRMPFKMGSLHAWLQAHIYLGSLALVFILAHSGFRFHATVPNLALLLLVLVILSGIAGWAIMIYLPSFNTSLKEWPVQPEEVCKRLTQIHDSIAEICSSHHDPFLQIYNDVVIPIYRSQGKAKPGFQALSEFAERIDHDEQQAFNALRELIEEADKKFAQLDLHLRFTRWLKSWLLVHIPLSIGLAVFSVTHIISIIRY